MAIPYPEGGLGERSLWGKDPVIYRWPSFVGERETGIHTLISFHFTTHKDASFVYRTFCAERVFRREAARNHARKIHRKV